MEADAAPRPYGQGRLVSVLRRTEPNPRRFLRRQGRSCSVLLRCRGRRGRAQAPQRLTPAGRRQVERVFLELLASRHPGTRWLLEPQRWQ